MAETQHYIQEIDRLRYQLQEQKIQQAELERMAKAMIDAAEQYKHASDKDKQQKFIILKNCEKRLREHFYPNKKKTSQATIDWLAQ